MKVLGFSINGTVLVESASDSLDTRKSLGEYGIDKLTEEDVDALLSSLHASDEDKGVLLAMKKKL
jgi:hypothetical protein